MSAFHNIQIQSSPEAEAQTPKEWDVYYYNDHRETVFIEREKSISLLTSQDKAELELRSRKIYRITSTWPRIKSDLSKDEIKKLTLLPPAEFQEIWDLVQLWTWNIHHDHLFPFLSQLIKDRKKPGEEELVNQDFWKTLIDVKKLKQIFQENPDRAIEIQEKLNQLKEKEQNTRNIL